MLKTKRLFKLNELEKDIQKDTINILLASGFLVTRINSGAFKQGNRFIEFYRILNSNQYSGFPDLLAIKGSRILLIEVKATKGKLRKSQQEFRDLAKQFGVEVLVVNDIEYLEEYLYCNNFIAD